MASRVKPGPDEQAAEDELQDLVKRAQRGEPVDPEALRRLLDGSPELWRKAGDLAGLAQKSLIALAAGENVLLRESLERRLAELNEQLAGPDPTPLERLLAQRVAMTWLQTAYADLSTQAARGQSPTACELQASADRRLLAAAKVLATVQSLAIPVRKQAWKPKRVGA